LFYGILDYYIYVFTITYTSSRYVHISIYSQNMGMSTGSNVLKWCSKLNALRAGKTTKFCITVALSLYNIKLTFIITYTVFQFCLNHQIDINQNPQLNLLALVDFETLIKEMQRAMVNLCNHVESLV